MKTHRLSYEGGSKTFRPLLAPIVFLLFLLAPMLVKAQFPYKETFRGETADNVVFGGSPGAFLTAAKGTGPLGVGSIDPDTQGFLRLTSAVNNQTGFVYSNDIFLGNYGLDITFEYSTYGGGEGGADGICFFLFDAGVTDAQFKIGGYGGSLGYSQKDGGIGVTKGYLGIGLDEYGNFSNKTEDRQGGNGFLPNSVALRGAGNGFIDHITDDGENYKYLTSTQTYDSDKKTGYKLAGGVRGPAVNTTGYRKAIINLVPDKINGGLTIKVSIYHDSQLVPDVVTYKYDKPIPAGGLKYGISSSTGGSNNYHEIRGLDITVDENNLDTPEPKDHSYTICQGKEEKYFYDILEGATTPNAGGKPQPSTVDLNPLTPEVEQELTLPGKGKFVFNPVTKLLEFTPAPGLYDEVKLSFTFRDFWNKLSGQGEVSITTLSPKIIVQPKDISVCANQSAAVFVSAIGTNLHYQWQYSSTPGDWKSVVDGDGVSGSTTNTVSLAIVPASLNGTQYRVIVTSDDDATCAVTSLPATLTVNPLPLATIGGTITQCKNTIPAVITLTGSNGTAPYTFTYTQDGITKTATSNSAGVFTIDQTVSVPGTFVYKLVSVKDASSTTCENLQTGTATIIVNPDMTLVLSSVPSSTNQNVLINTPIQDIVYTLTNATGAVVTGLPPGLQEQYLEDGTYTISGTPTAAGIFDYTITTTGNCGPLNLSGTIIVEDPAIKLIKKGVLNTDKNTITYTFEIINTGGVALNHLILEDIKLPGIPPIADTETIAPGDKKTITATYTITQEEKDAGAISNTAKASGVSPGKWEVSDVSGTDQTEDSPTLIDYPENPLISLIKKGELSTDKNTITYSFTIKNTGDVTLHNITLNDDKLGGLITVTPATLAPDAEATGTATYTITQEDRDAGQFSNTATATGLSPKDHEVSDISGTTNTDDNPTITPIAEAPGISLIKTGILSTDKKTITYSFLITNTGDVTLHNITLNDDKLGGLITVTPATLAPGDKATGSATYTILLEDRDAGEFSNTATATGLSPQNHPVSDISGTTDTDNVPTVTPIAEAPAISLIKKAALSTDKNTITYTFIIKNTGDVTLHGITLTDPKLGGLIAITPAILMPEGEATATVIYTVTQADRDAGEMNNTATANGWSPQNYPVSDISGTTETDDEHTITPIAETPAISLIKKAVLNTGQNTITYSFMVKNIGDVTLHNITLTDPKLGGLITVNPAILAPGTAGTASAVYTITQLEKDAGEVKNTAVAEGISPQDHPVSDISGTTQNDDLQTVTPVTEFPAVKLVKTGILSTDKNTITYSFMITNTGNVTLSNLVLNDIKLANIAPITGTLAPGLSLTVTAIYTITQAEKDAGLVTNTATVTATSPKGTPVNDISGTNQNNDQPTPVILPESPSIALVKTGVLRGNNDQIRYTFKITNTGNVTLSSITLTDVKLPGQFTITGTLLPEETKTFEADYIITQAEKDAGKVNNTATATGVSPANHKVTDISGTDQNNDNQTVITVPQTVSWDFTKIADGNVPSTVNDIITYTLKVTNTGTVTLYNIVVTDPNASITAGSPVAELAPGASALVKAAHQLTQDDIDQGKVINVATVIGKDPNGNTIDKDSDDPSTPLTNDPTITPVTQNGAITLIKKGAVNAGSTAVTFTFEIINTGNVTLHNIVLNDPLLGGFIRLNNTVLAPGQSTSITKSYTLTLQDMNSGKVINTATVKGLTPADVTVTDISGTELLNDLPTEVIITPVPGINLVKTGVLRADFSAITYSFLVTNTGNVTLTELDLTDEKIPAKVVLSKNTIDPGEVVSGSATYIVTDQEKRDGRVVNTATVAGKPPVGAAVTDISGTQANNDEPTLHIIDDVPVAIIDQASTMINQPVTFTITDNDLPSFNGLDKGSIVVTRFPENGHLDIHPDGTVTYTPNRTYSGPDQFIYTITDLKGKLSNRAVVNITVIPINLYIPNTFTPNGDGKNDTFQIIGRESYDQTDLVIINRWGNEVYRNKNYLDEWNGSGLSEGTYYYIITLKKGTSQVNKKGWILLKR